MNGNENISNQPSLVRQALVQGAIGVACGGAIGFLGTRVCTVLIPGSWILYSSLHNGLSRIGNQLIKINNHVINNHVIEGVSRRLKFSEQTKHFMMTYGMPAVFTLYSSIFAYGYTRLAGQRISLKGVALLTIANTIVNLAEIAYFNARKPKQYELL